MANCRHDANGICKSCKQTIAEGGNVALTPDVKPAAAPEPQWGNFPYRLDIRDDAPLSSFFHPPRKSA